MSWSQEQVRVLIDAYKNYPCLYAVKNVLYKNKHARISALEEIRAEIAKIRPNTTVADIKQKFCNLRTNFLAQHRKYINSIKSGIGSDEIYKPNVWYYDIMLFILEHTIPRPSVDSIPNSNSYENETVEEGEETQELQDDTIHEMSDINTQYDSQLQQEIVYNTPKKIHVLRVDCLDPSAASTSADYVEPLTTNSVEYVEPVEPINPLPTPKRKAVEENSLKAEKGKEKSKKRKTGNVSSPGVQVAVKDVMQDASSALKQISCAVNAVTNNQNEQESTQKTQSEIFGMFIASQMAAIEADEEIFVETQHDVSNVIYAARRQFLAKKFNS